MAVFNYVLFGDGCHGIPFLPAFSRGLVASRYFVDVATPCRSLGSLGSVGDIVTLSIQSNNSSCRDRSQRKVVEIRRLSSS